MRETVFSRAEADLPRLPAKHNADQCQRELCGRWDEEVRLAAQQRRAPSLWRVSWAVKKHTLIKSGLIWGVEVGLNFGLLYALTFVVDFLTGEGPTTFTTAIISTACLFVRSFCIRCVNGF